MVFVRVLLPIALRPLTYNSGGLELCAGMAVAVRLGKRKLYQGIVWEVGCPDPGVATKPVERILHNEPLADERQMRFWEWMADYYMCSAGEVMAAAIPSRLKPEGFSEKEFARGEFRRPTVKCVGLHPRIDSQEKLNAAFDSLRRARSQYKALVELCSRLDGDVFSGGVVPCGRAGFSPAMLRNLAAKDIVFFSEVEAAGDFTEGDFSALPPLTAKQEQAAGELINLPDGKTTALLQGPAGSGKTEVLLNVAAQTLNQGRSVLYLLPEIAVSGHIVSRFAGIFGSRLVPYHSGLTASRRAAVFMELAGGRSGAKIIIGTRTAVFLPFKELGLVIVDEEHDPGFKQDSPAPRFHARDSAMVLASLHNARTLLCSATPSIESFYNALSDKYGLVTLNERYGGAPLPRIILSDSLRAVKRGERTVHFNKLLLDKLGETLDGGGQAILFQNRRGFSPYVECGACGWVARCPDCNVTLTLHRSKGSLRCHYCGHHTAASAVCPSCGKGELIPRGFGTEKIEEELSKIFPSARIARLDGDTASSPRRAAQIVSDFEKGLTDILVGTRMVTKGFDFKGVRLVGVVNADNLLNYPDFRASERAFQLLIQAAGRAGRGDVQGDAVIQSSQPEHPVLRQVEAWDYTAMAQGQLAERQAFFYPPYCRLITITVKHRERAMAESAAIALASLLRPVFGRRVLGPEPAVVDKVMGEHIMLLMLKVERGKSFAEARRLLLPHIETIKKHKDFKNITLICNVDPQ